MEPLLGGPTNPVPCMLSTLFSGVHSTVNIIFQKIIGMTFVSDRTVFIRFLFEFLFSEWYTIKIVADEMRVVF